MYRGAAFCGDMTESLGAGLMGRSLYDLACLPVGQIDRFVYLTEPDGATVQLEIKANVTP